MDVMDNVDPMDSMPLMDLNFWSEVIADDPNPPPGEELQSPSIDVPGDLRGDLGSIYGQPLTSPTGPAHFLFHDDLAPSTSDSHDNNNVKSVNVFGVSDNDSGRGSSAPDSRNAGTPQGEKKKNLEMDIIANAMSEFGPLSHNNEFGSLDIGDDIFTQNLIGAPSSVFDSTVLDTNVQLPIPDPDPTVGGHSCDTFYTSHPEQMGSAASSVAPPTSGALPSIFCPGDNNNDPFFSSNKDADLLGQTLGDLVGGGVKAPQKTTVNIDDFIIKQEPMKIPERAESVPVSAHEERPPPVPSAPSALSSLPSSFVSASVFTAQIPEEGVNAPNVAPDPSVKQEPSGEEPRTQSFPQLFPHRTPQQMTNTMKHHAVMYGLLQKGFQKPLHPFHPLNQLYAQQQDFDNQQKRGDSNGKNSTSPGSETKKKGSNSNKSRKKVSKNGTYYDYFYNRKTPLDGNVLPAHLKPLPPLSPDNNNSTAPCNETNAPQLTERSIQNPSPSPVLSQASVSPLPPPVQAFPHTEAVRYYYHMPMQQPPGAMPFPRPPFNRSSHPHPHMAAIPLALPPPPNGAAVRDKTGMDAGPSKRPGGNPSHAQAIFYPYMPFAPHPVVYQQQVNNQHGYSDKEAEPMNLSTSGAPTIPSTHQTHSQSSADDSPNSLPPVTTLLQKKQHESRAVFTATSFDDAAISVPASQSSITTARPQTNTPNGIAPVAPPTSSTGSDVSRAIASSPPPVLAKKSGPKSTFTAPPLQGKPTATTVPQPRHVPVSVPSTLTLTLPSSSAASSVPPVGSPGMSPLLSPLPHSRRNYMPGAYANQGGEDRKRSRSVADDDSADPTDGNSSVTSGIESGSSEAEDTSINRFYSSQEDEIRYEKRQQDTTGYRFTLDAPISTSQKLSEDRLTYLNKSQVYKLELSNISTRLDPSTPVKTLITVIFRGQVKHEIQSRWWSYWYRKHSLPRPRILDIDSRAVEEQEGIVSVREVAWNAAEILWYPYKGPCKVNLAIHCLSTDFSHQKGFKGIPMHIELYTQEDFNHSWPAHRAFSQVKVFCEKGAERKARDEARKQERRKSGKLGAGEREPTFWPYQAVTEFYSLVDLFFTPPLFHPPLLWEPPFSDAADHSVFSAPSSGDKRHVAREVEERAAKIPRKQVAPVTPQATQPSVLLFLRLEEDPAYTPVRLSAPTQQALRTVLIEKFSLRQTVTNLYKKCRNDILVKMEDELVQSLQNETPLVLEVKKKGEDSCDVILTEK